MADKYWWPSGGTGSSTGAWSSTTNWSSSSASYVSTTAPTGTDNANFGSYSGSSAFTVTIAAAANCANLTIANANMTLAGTGALAIAGAVTVSTFANRTYTGIITFGGSGPGPFSLNFGSMTLASALIFSGTGTRTLASNLTTNGQITHTAGTITAGTFNVQASAYSSTSGAGRVLNMGSGTWTITGGGTNWNVFGSLTVNCGTSTINLANSGGTTFIGGSKTYYNLNLGSSYAKTISGSNVFNNITNSVQPTTLTLAAGTTQTVTSFNVNGTLGNLVTLNSNASSSQATLSCPSGTISCDYLNIKDSIVTGGATWTAGLNSIDSGNNSGWNFLGASKGNFFLLLG